MPISDYTLTIKLKQHTPIIHFQHDQAGATLRATEVKAKLDKFLISKLLGFNEGNLTKNKNQALKTMQQKYPSWLIGGKKAKHLSLNYKIRIEANTRDLNIKMPDARKKQKNDRTVEWSNSYPNFFGNMGIKDKSNLKDLVYHNNVDLIIICLNPKLKQEINEIISEFFNYYNFGTRQNKGFGSFSVLEESNQITYPAELPYFQFDLEKKDGKAKKIQDLFTVIQFYYQRLKSGINFCPKGSPPVYHHSYLKLYLSQNTTYRWEKPWVKDKLTSINVNLNGNEYFARALLGLPYEFRFMSNPKIRCNPNPSKKLLPKYSVNVQIENTDQDLIERIKSPIMFKPIISNDEVRVYVIAKPFVDPPINRNFKFSTKQKSNTLSTPPKEIDLADLIDKYHKHLGKSFVAMNFNGSFQTTVNVF